MRQRVLCARITRETNNVLHDVYVLPTGRIYYRRNMREFQTEIPPGVGALVDLRRAVGELKEPAAHYLKGGDLFNSIRELRHKADVHHCTLDTQYLDLETSAM